MENQIAIYGVAIDCDLSLGRRNAAGDREDAEGKFHPVGGADAGEDPRQVRADGPDAGLQFTGDLLVLLAVEDQGHYRGLPGREFQRRNDTAPFVLAEDSRLC